MELAPHPQPSGRSAKPIKCWVQSRGSWRWPEAGLVSGSGNAGWVQPGEAVRLTVAGQVRPGMQCGSSGHALCVLGLSLDPHFLQPKWVKIVPASQGCFGMKLDDTGKALNIKPSTCCTLCACSSTEATVSRAACPVELSGMTDVQPTQRP